MDDEWPWESTYIPPKTKGCTASEVLSLRKKLNQNNDTYKFIGDSSYNNAIDDVLAIIYKNERL